jgi:uncharacterized lipoprotein YmbA
MISRTRSCLPLLLCAVACSSGPPRRTYLLTPPLDQTTPTTTTPSPAGGSMARKQRLEVRRILVPDYLDSSDILMRSGSNELKASATGGWGERFSLGLTRAVVADLAARMPQYSIVEDGSSSARRQLRITISALDLWPDGSCVLAANWSIFDQDSSIPVTSGSGTFDSVTANGTVTASDANLVDAVTRTVGKLADSIVLDAQASPESADLRIGPSALKAD